MMSYNECVRASERNILIADIGGYHCEVVEIDGACLLYVDGYFEGELYEEESESEYIAQVREILDIAE
jgi:hypothetical protein